MKTIEISDGAYQAIAEAYGDVAGYIERTGLEVAQKVGGKPKELAPTLLEIAGRIGVVGTFRSGKGDLSTNPDHLEGFGR